MRFDVWVRTNQVKIGRCTHRHIHSYTEWAALSKSDAALTEPISACKRLCLQFCLAQNFVESWHGTVLHAIPALVWSCIQFRWQIFIWIMETCKGSLLYILPITYLSVLLLLEIYNENSECGLPFSFLFPSAQLSYAGTSGLNLLQLCSQTRISSSQSKAGG